MSKMKNNHVDDDKKVDKDIAMDDTHNGEAANNDVTDNDKDDDGKIEYGWGANFLYTDERKSCIPSSVVRIKVDPSVKNIDNDTFKGFKSLTTVVLSEGLERIGNSAFELCESLLRINVPSTVKVIGRSAFICCHRLKDVKLPEGLEELGELAFFCCASLRSVTIPTRLTSIRRSAFCCCFALEHVILREGLEYIGNGSFDFCSRLSRIDIPSTVKKIHPKAFGRDLRTIKFCDEMEEFVSRVSCRDWWDSGISEYSLKTYNFLVRCNVPARLDMLSGTSWQATIQDMFHHIPSVAQGNLAEYFNTVDSMLTVYEIAQNMSLLELAIWKSKICDQYGSNMDNVSGIMRLQSRANCGACVIIPQILPFLLKDKNCLSRLFGT